MKKLTLMLLLATAISFGCNGPKQTTTNSDGMSRSGTMKDGSMMRNRTDSSRTDSTKPH